jgi:hypothetical protein
MLRNAFKKVEEIENFQSFVASGIDHLVTEAIGDDTTNANDKMGDSSESAVLVDTLDTRPNAQKKAEVPVGTIEKMKDILVSIDRVAAMLRTGLKGDGEDLYSTRPEDYLDLGVDSDADAQSGVADILNDENEPRPQS